MSATNPLKPLPIELLAKRFLKRGLELKLAGIGVGLRNQNDVVESHSQRAERYARQQAKRKKTLALIKTDRNAKRAAVRRRKKRRGIYTEVSA